MRYHRKSHRYKRRKPVYRNRFFWFFLLFLIVVCSLCYFVFFTQTFKIKEVKVSGNEKISAEAIESIARNQLEEEGDLFFVINPGKIKMAILSTYPEIGLAEVKMRLPDKIIIEVKERKDVGVFCLGDSPCFKIDEEGIMFENVGITESHLIIKDAGFRGGTQLGEKVIEKNDLNKILNINSQLEQNLNISVREFLIVSTDKLIAVAEDNWEIYFNLQNDVEWQLMKLKVLFEEKIPPEERRNLEYIELRFGNFANPKFGGVSTP